MTKLFGVDISAQIASAMGGLLLPMKLVRVTPGTRTAGDLTSGTNPSTKTYPCRGVVEDYSLRYYAEDLVQKGDRKALILGGTLPAGVVPQLGDHVVIEGVESQVIDVRRDPAGASYELQVRGA